jgi:hypothetical protein
MFCATELVFGGTDGAGPNFHFFCALRLVLGSNVSVRSTFHVFRSRTHFQRYRGSRVHFSCFALPSSFLVVSRASGPVFMFYAPRLVFGGNAGAESTFHISRSQTHFQQY